jgi:hypothetical protein
MPFLWEQIVDLTYKPSFDIVRQEDAVSSLILFDTMPFREIICYLFLRYSLLCLRGISMICKRNTELS